MKKAFSLLELIISLAIISILIVILSSFFKVNFKTLSTSFSREKEYKDACTAMLYMDTNIRRSTKIEARDNDQCNFYFYKSKSVENETKSEEKKPSKTKCYFYQKDGFLRIYGDNLATGPGGTPNNISRVKDVRLILDEENKIIRIYLKSSRGNFNFETAIDVGDKL
ncbi:prepilin-type N-terminal cleavage/methylation domain-containing protein [uncultured Anaerococcus sp.]|uniref:prepilin-type N-terminal cleavage/methylation domain-containing protein n=1 Tax=uncultured Anaerococcus sp. TaxID=293428 RepID=UPI0025FE8202|nr:prepilin-type N-terminal cleavage/methylation domain-containing protein [uncultured Anaerococcus sp.]